MGGSHGKIRRFHGKIEAMAIESSLIYGKQNVLVFHRKLCESLPEGM
jgi:hypothetical protein